MISRIFGIFFPGAWAVCLLTILASLAFPSPALAQAQPLDVSGFNAVGVADSASSGAIGGFSFYDLTYAQASGFSSGGTAGAFPTSPVTGISGNVYNFAPAGTGDVLVSGGTLTLNTPVSGLSSLFILGTSVNGASTINYSLNFSDSTTLTGSLSYADWFGHESGDVIGLGRQSNGIYDSGNGNNFSLYDPSITIPQADQLLTLQSITFSGSSGGQPAIFAISGISAAPEPSIWALIVGGLGLLAHLQRRSRRS